LNPALKWQYSEALGRTQAEIPWARLGGNFTLLMEVLVLTLAKKLHVSAIAQMFAVSENRIRRAINVHVETSRESKQRQP